MSNSSEAHSRSFTFAVFTWAWAFIVLMGMSSENMSATVLGVIVVVACAWALVRPRDPRALLAVALAYFVHFLIDDYRAKFVHTWFDFVNSAMILLALGHAYAPDPERWRDRLVERLGFPAVVMAALCFFAAGMAKVNLDFIDERLSCASAFYSYQIAVPPYSWLMPDTPMGRNLAIGGTIVMELLGPVLLLFKKTRRAGFVICFVMMFLLGTNSRARYYVFVGPFLALMTLTFEWEQLEEHWKKIPEPVIKAAQIALVLWIVLAMTRGEVRENLVTRHLTARIMVVPAMLALGAAGLFLPLRPEREVVWKKLAWAPVVFMLVFEILPYFGLKTSRNFTMAANFRVGPKYSNHLLLKSALPVPGDYEAWRKRIGALRPPKGPHVANCPKKRRGEDTAARDARARGITRGPR